MTGRARAIKLGSMAEAELDIDGLKKRLLDEREQLRAASTGDAESRKPVALDQASVGRLSRMDAMQVQAMAQEAERRRQRRLHQIDAALDRIRSDEYGFCVSCGADMDVKRLQSDPAAASCIACAGGG